MHFEGHRHCAIYAPASGDFSIASDMGPQPGRSTGGGRWYPTLCTLADGDVLAFQGHPAGDDTRHGNNTADHRVPICCLWSTMLAGHVNMQSSYRLAGSVTLSTNREAGWYARTVP
jgi:hypothetical protein